MTQEKKTDTQEEFPEANHGEVGDVTITEYRKNQIVRLTECFIVSPLCIYTGIKYRKELPKLLSVSLVVFGAATLIYNGRNFIVNWNRDGKLIRQAIKQKKEDEKKIRDRVVKGEPNTVYKTIEKKQQAPPPPVHKAEDVKPKEQEKAVTPIVNGLGVANHSKEVFESPIEITEATIVRPVYDNNIKEAVVSDSNLVIPEVTTAQIIEDKKENIESVSEKKIEVEAVMENPVISERPKNDSDKNGNDSKVVG